MQTNDLHATLLHLQGLQHDKLTYRFNGRDFRLTDVGGNVISDILDTASAAIDEGDRAKDSNRFDDAIAKYDTVPTIVSVIPDDERQSVKEDKDKLVQLSASKKEEAKVAKIRYEQAMQEQAAAATAAPGGAAPAPAPAPAPAQ